MAKINLGLPIQGALTTEEWNRRMDIRGALSECVQAFETGVFNKGVAPTIVFRGTFAYTLSCLTDALQKLKKAGKPIAFVDDVQIGAKISDVTDLIREARNAACHINSDMHEIGTNYVQTEPVFGKQPAQMRIHGVEIGASDYADDCAVWYGSMRIYRDRHVYRALEEAVTALQGM